MGVLMTREFGADIGKELHGALLNSQGVEQFLHELAILAAQLVRGGLSCGMTMLSERRPLTVACSDPVAARVDEVQYECLGRADAGEKTGLARGPYPAIALVADFADDN